MEFEITMEPEPYKVKLSWTWARIATIILISILGSTGVDYVIPASGSGNTDLNAKSDDLATKEYISVNYVSRDKLADTVLNLQNQINSLQTTVNKLDTKLDLILKRLPPRKYDDE